jgi:dTDP-4-amino-4,6-dideoxygalactose transaminase
MIPRKKLDIGWLDLGVGGLSCLFPPDRCDIQARVEQSENTLATLSVRTGFDLLLQHLALPRGSEVLMSAITIRDMVSIIEHHGYAPCLLMLTLRPARSISIISAVASVQTQK